MPVGDLMVCEHCPPEVYTETLENGATVERTRPTSHRIEAFVPARTVEQETHVGTHPKTGKALTEVRAATFNDGRPILHCPTLYTDQIHESPGMRLVGTMERG